MTSKITLSTLPILIACLLHPPSPAQTKWTTPIQLNPTAYRNGMPRIAIGPNDEVMIACYEFPDSLQTSYNRIAVYVSTNHGQDFVRTLIPLPGAPQVIVGAAHGASFDRQGSIFVFWQWRESDFGPEHLVLSKSTDRGTTFLTFWEVQQSPFFSLRENPFFIDANNSIHVVWDSTRTDFHYVLRYSKFVGGNPSNMITYAVPRPDTLGNWTNAADMLVLDDTLHFCIQTPEADVSHCYYTRSVNGGVSYSPFRLIDSLARQPRLEVSGQGVTLFYAHHNSVFSPGVPMLRFVLSPSDSLSNPVGLGTMLTTIPAAKSLISQGGRDFIVYDGFDGAITLGCYYEFVDINADPIDSAFFPHLVETVFAIDSDGGKFLVGRHQTDFKLYITHKDIISGVSGAREITKSQRNSIVASAVQTTRIVTIALELHEAIDGVLKIYDILGREILHVHTGSFAAGGNTFVVNAQAFSNGTYFASLKSKTGTLVSKFLLLR